MKTIHLNEKRYFSMDYDEDSDLYYLSFPLGKGTMDYMEYYVIPKTIVEEYPSNIEEVEKFVKACRKGDMFHLGKRSDYKEGRGGPWEPQDL